MTLPSIREGLSAIAGEVLADAQKEAQALLAEAQASAKQTLRKSKEQADKTYDQLTEAASAKTDAEVRRVQSLTEVNARNMLLQMKENLIEQTYQTALEQLSNFTHTKQYRSYLMDSVVEATKKVGAKKVRIQLNAADAAWFKAPQLKEASEAVGAELTLMKQRGEWVGGCKAQTEDQKLIYDNTIESRLKQVWPELRLEIAKLLFTEEAT